MASYCSDQTAPLGRYGAVSPSAHSAAAVPWSCAFCQDSNRTGPPASACTDTATSPAAYTSGADVRQYSSTNTPRWQAMPASRASASLAFSPTPSTTACAAMRVPSASSATGRPSSCAWTASRLAPSMTLTPASACIAARYADTPGSTLRAHSRGACSSTVTWVPAWRAVAATSNPIHPPPTISTCLSGPNWARRRSASSRVRSTCTPAWSTPGNGGTTGRPPMHRISLS
ncbi:hypothetical protein D3C86_1274430 [compost metagenome]